MSKSGLYAHFGSKEDLQLATVDTAREIFDAEVVEPTQTIVDPLERLRTLGAFVVYNDLASLEHARAAIDNWLSHALASAASEPRE